MLEPTRPGRVQARVPACWEDPGPGLGPWASVQGDEGPALPTVHPRSLSPRWLTLPHLGPPPSPGPAYLTGLDFSFPAASLCLAGSPWQLPLLLQQRDSPASRIARDGKGEAPTLEMRDILHSYSLTPS